VKERSRQVRKVIGSILGQNLIKRHMLSLN